MKPGVQELGEQLDLLLARSYVLYSAARWFEGDPGSRRLPSGTLGTIAAEIALTVEAIAERIAVLGLGMPSTMAEILRPVERAYRHQGWDVAGMVAQLREGEREVILQIRRALAAAAAAGDEMTRALLAERRDVHLAGWLRLWNGAIGGSALRSGASRRGRTPGIRFARRATRSPGSPAA